MVCIFVHIAKYECKLLYHIIPANKLHKLLVRCLSLRFLSFELTKILVEIYLHVIVHDYKLVVLNIYISLYSIIV